MSNELAVSSGVSAVGFLQDQALFDRVERFATIMASGKATIPVELRNAGDCMAITLQALQWQMNPISLAQKVFFIQGKIGYEAQAIAAAINTHHSISSPFAFEWFGPWEKIIGKFEIKKNDKGQQYRVPGWKLEDEEGLGIQVSATLRGESAPRVLNLLLAQARTRNSTQWADDPKQQLAYLAQKKWARLYAPHIILGAYTPDELANPAEVDMGVAEVIETRKPSGRPALPEYTDKNRAADVPSVTKAVKLGKVTVDKALSQIRTRFTVSPEQEALLRKEVDAALAPTEAAAPAYPSPEQRAELNELAQQWGIGDAEICQRFGVASINEIAPAQHSAVVSFIMNGD